MPFTTRPPCTSRQAMMRLASVSQGTEVLQNVHAEVARFLWMKLHPEQVPSFYDRSKWLFVGTGRYCVNAQRRAIGVGEVHISAGRNSGKQSRLSYHRNAIPSHVGRFHGIGKSCTSPAKHAQATQFRRLAAALKHPLQAQTNPQQRCLSRTDSITQCGSKLSFPQRGCRLEVPDSRNNPLLGMSHNVRVIADDALRTEVLNRLRYRCQVPGSVINNCNHSRPLVVGNILANCLSFEQATRNARANALNSASILWWLERP